MTKDGTPDVGKNDPLRDYRRKFWLAPDEELIWAGRPDPVALRRRARARLVSIARSMAILFLVLAVVVVAGIGIELDKFDARIAVVSLWLPFMISAWGIWAGYRRMCIGEHNVYGVTSSKVILHIRNLNATTTHTNLGYADVNDLRVDNLEGGVGDVHLRETASRDAELPNETVLLSAIPDAVAVAQMIRERLPRTSLDRLVDSGFKLDKLRE